MTLLKRTLNLLNSWKPALHLIVAIACLAAASTPLHAAAIAVDQPQEQATHLADRDPVASFQRESSRLHTAQITLARAIEIAVQRHAGARVVDVSFDGTAVLPIFRVLTASGSRIVEDHVNASTGTIDDSSIFSELAQLEEGDRRNVKSLLRSNLNLSDAVRVAEKQTSGQAIGAGLLRVEGSLRFGVVVLRGDDLTQVFLDPPRRSKIK
jgi:uncharacterized membrane protein YkoI